MDKPKLLYVSPFWPKRSGISEYSEILIEGLNEFFDITLVIDDYKINSKKIKEKYNIITYKNDTVLPNYDFVLYNFGNNPEYHSYMYDMIIKYPGHVILHDYVLYYLTVGYYSQKNKLFQKIYEMEGVHGMQIIKDSLKENQTNDLLQHKNIASYLPLNKEILGLAKGIFVHSLYTKNMIEKFLGIDRVFVIPHVNTLSNTQNISRSNDFLNRKYNIKKGSYIIGAVGFIGPTKQNELTCLAVKEYNKRHNDKIYYVMIGDGNYVDHLLDDYIIKTGFLENEDFYRAIHSCDLIMNLRYPYNGESSSTLIQCMSMGKPCVVTDIGWFSELPDDTVIKIPIDISLDVFVNLIERLKEKNLGLLKIRAQKYINEQCMPLTIARNIYKYMSEW